MRMINSVVCVWNPLCVSALCYDVTGTDHGICVSCVSLGQLVQHASKVLSGLGNNVVHVSSKSFKYSRHVDDTGADQRTIFEAS